MVPLDVTCCRNDRVTSWCARLWTGGLQGWIRLWGSGFMGLPSRCQEGPCSGASFLIWMQVSLAPRWIEVSASPRSTR